jgi:hypothetical protein
MNDGCAAEDEDFVVAFSLHGFHHRSQVAVPDRTQLALLSVLDARYLGSLFIRSA